MRKISMFAHTPDSTRMNVSMANEPKTGENYRIEVYSLTKEVGEDRLDSIEGHEYPDDLRVVVIVAALAISIFLKLEQSFWYGEDGYVEIIRDLGALEEIDELLQ
ncbi:hypothetical protein BCON_0969g00010 [Botryotinia convoluta]|uniref:Uncharacterized protein n=1 Tax=Botryotinia convoluta TaxID=54673 RepID=A0A4Z1HFE6_9HELO|nr:hypothetical protein BCON_0969g00010 [Botryotinia convoluta]